MKKLLRFLIHPLLLVVLGLLALAALIWWVGPLIAIGDRRPLDGVVERLLLIALPLLIWAVIAGLRAWRRKRANAQMVAGLRGGPSASDREAQVLGERFDQALKVLDESARQTGRRSLLRRRAYLYDLPWYVFIGAPGSGKTTALLNAGLNFPLAGKLGQSPVKGVGGTRHCDWWFTEEAVLIDTAGRYTLQQSDEQADAAAWGRFLDLLRRTRPRRPLNGVLLTVNVQDLLQQTPADRKDHAARLRTRLRELNTHLGVRPPVYVLLTKTDLIAGFNETFGELGKEEREQVWGFTFPHDPAGRESPLRDFPNEFASLEARLRTRLIDRLQAETDLMKRAAIFSFPQQFAGLKGLLGGFLEQVFDGDGTLEERSLLRGVYFTSGTQEGTPIDRVLGTLARTFGVEGKGPATTAAGRGGKSFFLARLLREVIFAEQGLVGENRLAEGRRRRMRLIALGSLAACSALLLAGWAISFLRNQAYIDQVAQRVPPVKTAVEALPPAESSDLAALLPVLDQLRAVPQPEGFPLAEPPLAWSLGLYQGPYLAAGTEIGYSRLLDRALLPRVTRRLEERLRAVSRDNLELAYEALKAYLMLYTPDQFDPEALRAWVTLDWDQNLARVLSETQRQALAGHLDAALARGAPQAIAPMDAQLVANVREMLVAFPLEYRIFSRLKRAQVGADLPEFSAAAAGGPQAVQVFQRQSGKPLTQGIPGLFTRDGYFKAFKGALLKVGAQLANEQRWVLGVKTPAGAADAARSLTGEDELSLRVRRLYLQEYIKVWDAYLADVKLLRLDGLERSLSVARILAAPDSPLAAYLRAVSRETQLGAAVEAAQASPGTLASRIGERADKAKSELAALAGSAGTPPPSAEGGPLEAMVDRHFAAIHRMVSGQPAPIDEVLKLFNDIQVQLTAIDAAQKSRTAPPPATAGAAAMAAAGLQPEPIKSMLEGLASAGASQGRTAERQGLSAELKPLTELCSKTIAGRFPFAQGSAIDVLPDDFGQMFGAGGALDDFYQRRLATLVDVGVTPWAYKPLPDGRKPPGGSGLAEFQRAARIKEAFFRSGGKAPGFKVDLRVIEMDEGLKEISLDVDGQVLRFAAGNTTAQTLGWPSSRVASQIRLQAAGGTAQVFEGPWALFRLFAKFENQPSTQPERFVVVLNLDGRKARLEVISASAINPLRMRELQTFRCPDSL